MRHKYLVGLLALAAGLFLALGPITPSVPATSTAEITTTHASTTSAPATQDAAAIKKILDAKIAQCLTLIEAQKYAEVVPLAMAPSTRKRFGEVKYAKIVADFSAQDIDDPQSKLAKLRASLKAAPNATFAADEEGHFAAYRFGDGTKPLRFFEQDGGWYLD